MYTNIGHDTPNSIVESNYIYNVDVGIQIDGGCNYAIVRNNFVYSCGYAHISLISRDSTSWGTANYNKIYNNTIFSDNATCTIGFAITHSGSEDGVGNEFKNNIVYNNARAFFHVQGGAGSQEGTGITLDYNCYYNTVGSSFNLYWEGTTYTNFNTYKTASSQDANTVTSDPTILPNGLLITGSPCINAGTDVSNPFDYRGIQRDSTPDIGAYEYVVGVQMGTSAEGVNW